MIWSYAVAVFTHHKAVPRDFTIKKDEDDFERFCGVCSRAKPERSHHCRKCMRCIKKMDHHCFWMNNCIGYHNYKAFLLFVSFVSLNTGFAFACHIVRIYSMGLPKFSSADDSHIVFGIVTSAVFFLLVSNFTVNHYYFLLTNYTTLEYWRRVDEEEEDIHCGHTWFQAFFRVKAASCYDLGLYHNFTDVFGSNPLLWILPINTSCSKGLYFQKRKCGT